MKAFIVAFTILGAVPALAQNPLTTTQSPPAGGSSESTPNTTNSVPKTAGTEKPTQQPGSTVGGATLTQPLGTSSSGSVGTTTGKPPAAK